MRWVFPAALLVGGCTAHQIVSPAPVPRVAVINEDGGCPPGAMAPKPPPIPRTARQVADWAARLDASLKITERARYDCDRKLDAVLRDVHEFNARQLSAAHNTGG